MNSIKTCIVFHYTRYLCVSLILLTISVFSFGQKLPTSLQQTEWLESGDVKKWGKLTETHNDADRLLVESNNTYLDIGSIEDDESVDPKKRQKQIDKLEDQALNLYIQALNKYKGVYEAMYGILNNYMGEPERALPPYSSMRSNNDEAEALYSECKKASTDEERDKFSKANELMLISIESGISIFVESPEPEEKVSYVDVVEYSESQAQAQSEEEDLKLDSEMYQRYKNYMSDSSMSDPVVLSQLMQLDRGENGFEAFQEMWNNYLSNEKLSVLQKKQIDKQILDSVLALQGLSQTQTGENNSLVYEEQSPVSKASQTTDVSNASGINDNSIESTISNHSDVSNESSQYSGDKGVSSQSEGSLNSSTTISSKNVSNTQDVEVVSQNSQTPAVNHSYSSKESSSGTANSSKVNIGVDNEFRVQIAASKGLLSVSQLKAIYPGDLSIYEVKEGSYYKYQIRGFRMFSEAQIVCGASEVENAYLTAYSSSNNVSLGAAMKENRQFEQNLKKSGQSQSIQSIDFVVQLAASKGRLSNNQLKSLYSGSYLVSVVIEEGWYKYQLFAGANLQGAFNILENCGVNNAFLVAYKNGRKLKLYKALHEYKSHKP